MPQHTTFHILLETSRQFTRKLLRGVIRWSNLYGPVTLVASTGHVEQEFPKLERTESVGVISRLTTPGLIEAKQRWNFPVVTIEPSQEKYDIRKRELQISEILSNGPAIVRLAAEHFLSRGFVHFGFCGLPLRIWSDVREKEFQRQIAQQGLECSVYPFPDPLRALSREEEAPFLARWLATLPKPVAVLACNDDRGVQLIEICDSEGYLMPDQVAVLGVDDDDLICELTHPSLSSIALDLENTGFRAAQLLWDLISGNASGYHCLPLEPTQVVTRLSTDVTAQNDELINRAIRFIRGNYQYPIGPGDVARELDVSRRTLERRFANVLGRSVREQIQLFRLEQAKELLVYTDDSVERIAELTGFGNFKPMLRSFVKFEDTTPTRFRKQNVVI